MDALWQGLRLARHRGIQKFEINVNTTTVVQFLEMSKPPWDGRTRVERIKMSMATFQEVEMKHCCREKNSLADAGW